MSEPQIIQDERWKIGVDTKLYCLNVDCVNLVPIDNCCNLKRLVMSPGHKCAGFVKMGPKKKKPVKKTVKKK